MRPLVYLPEFNYVIPEPSTYSGTISTVVDAARNVKGVMVGSVIRSNIAKVELTWNLIDPVSWSNMLNKFNEAYGGKYKQKVEFFVSARNDWETREMYVSGDITDNGVWLRDEKGNIRGYKGARLALIEV